MTTGPRPRAAVLRARLASHGLPWVAVALATAVLAAPLVRHEGLPSGADVIFAYQSAQGFARALGEGVLYPRWIDDSNRRFGAPTFVFYGPLAYYTVAAACPFADHVVGALRIALIAAAFASGVALVLAARERSSPFGTALGAAFYVLAPYHMLDLHDRFAFAEFVAFAAFPLLFLAARRTVEGRGLAGVAGLAAVWAGLLLTHLVTAYMALFVLAPYVVVQLARRGAWRRLGALAVAGALGLAIAAVHLVPALGERGLVHLEWAAEAFYGDFRRNFVYHDEAALGLPSASIKPWVNSTTTTQGALAAAALAVLVARLGFRRSEPARDEPRGSTGAGSGAQAGARPADGTVDDARFEGLVQAGLSLWTLVLQTALSVPLWRWVPELATVQFPWRFGAFQALAASLLVAHALARRRGLRAARPVLAACVLALAAIPALVVSYRVVGHRGMGFTPEEADAPGNRERIMPWFVPVGVRDWRSPGALGEAAPAALALPSGRVEVVAWKTHARRLRVEAREPTALFVRTFAYPGWRARLDGHEAPLRADTPMHLIRVDVPPGTHDVELAFRPTPLRRAAAAVSALGVAAWLGLVLLALRRGGRRRLRAACVAGP